MSSVPSRRWTREEYLAHERSSEHRSEYVDGDLFAMAGGTARHALICDNLLERTRGQLRGGPCKPFSSSMRIKVQALGNFLYPDLSIVCGKWEFEDEHEDTLLNPRVIVEVLSPTTERFDRGRKFGIYQHLPSLAEYILISQDEPRVERFVRQDTGWFLETVEGLSGVLDIASVSSRLPLAEIYEEVAFGLAAG